MRGMCLEETESERDLSVIVDASLKFCRQAAAAVAKANQILAIIRRLFELIDKFILPLLYKTLVRPHLEFGNVAWGPFNRADQLLVERVQRRATHLVASLRHRPYEERLEALKLPSLFYRRRRSDMVQVYQIFHGGVDLVLHCRCIRPHPRPPMETQETQSGVKTKETGIQCPGGQRLERSASVGYWCWLCRAFQIRAGCPVPTGQTSGTWYLTGDTTGCFRKNDFF